MNLQPKTKKLAGLKNDLSLAPHRWFICGEQPIITIDSTKPAVFYRRQHPVAVG
ncbi:MAG: hypothetical protein WCS94_21390 [Verrucomicrobiota bacterium]